MDEALIAGRLEILVEAIESLSKAIGLRVEVVYIFKRNGKSERKKDKGRITKISQLDPWNEWPPYFLMINTGERRWLNVDFFGNNNYILSIKDLVTKEFLYQL